MDERTWAPIRDLLARTATDAGLRDRMVADPKETLLDEAGIALPDDWTLVATVGATGAVELNFADELPVELLDMVGGGASVSYSFPPHIGGPGSLGGINYNLRPGS